MSNLPLPVKIKRREKNLSSGRLVEDFTQKSVNPANFQNFQNIFGCEANTCGVSQECNEASRTAITATWKCSLIFRDVSAVSVGFICA